MVFEGSMANLWQNKLLVVIPSINGGDLLARMLPTLQFPQSNVVVLDQGSTDETISVCAENGTEVVQLGRAHTYTQACNIGAQLARDRNKDYLCVSNNDITFKTDVLSELIAEMERDPKLAIVAPSQIIFDGAHHRGEAAYRVFWNLNDLEFTHDTTMPYRAVRRLEADFCELTCAVVRMSAIDEIGFLDDEFGFYHEDADFGFRLRKAGYTCAYLPKSQIDHFVGSTISREKDVRKADYLARNRQYFAKKHLGYGIDHDPDSPGAYGEWAQFSLDAHPYISRYGLLNPEGPNLIVSKETADPGGYFYTAFDADTVTDRTVAFFKQFSAVLATTKPMRNLCIRRGIVNSFYIPLGIDTDTFHPWGLARRIYDVTTYLAIVHGQQQQLLQTIMDSWTRFRSSGRDAKLILYGQGIARCMGRSAHQSYRSGNAEVAHYPEEGIDLYDVHFPETPDAVAELLRSVDYTITGSHGEACALPVLRSVACGTPCLIAGPRSSAESTLCDGLGVADLIGGGVGEILHCAPGSRSPCAPSTMLVALLETTYSCRTLDRDRIVADGMAKVRSEFTLRNTAMELYAALAHLQIRRPSNVLKRFASGRAIALRGLNANDERGKVLVTTLPRRFNTIGARRVRTAGLIAAQFGLDWEKQGLSSATKAVAAELTYFTTNRSKRMLRFRRAATRRLWGRSPLRAVLLVGYIDALLGLGQSLRGLALALAQSDVQFSIFPFGVGVEGRRSTPYMPERYDETNPYVVNVIEVAVDELPTIFQNIDERHFDRSYNVLRTYWELSRAPDIWRDNLAAIDELWVPNAFVADSFRSVFDRTITIVPPCVSPASPRPTRRKSFGLAEGVFYFMFSFDYHSFPQRKNPLGVVRAFRKAFPDSSTSVGLIIKSSGMVGHHPSLKAELRVAAEDDARIQLIDEALSQQDMLSLIAAADCYVSLHRSEGFGFGMAEAMAFGKPVIGTAYSGNVEFLSEETGYPVPYSLKRIAADEYIHTKGQVWAYPDEAACSIAMVRVFNDPTEATAKANAARRFVKERYGPENVGDIAKRRLDEILSAISE